LNLKKYREEQKEIRNRVKQIDTLNKTSTQLEVEALSDDLKKLEYDEGKSERFKQWIKNLRTDIYLDESVRVINDMIVQNNLVYNNKK
jgi:carboxyl-terminal processing protease